MGLFAGAASATDRTRAAALIMAARTQVGVTLGYDPTYTRIAMPGGDVARATGVCTDVVVRAYRDAFGLDLQALVHADMRDNFAAYPKRWGLRAPDPNIDHRRVPNLQTFFRRAGAELPCEQWLTGWNPGDLFTCLINGISPHIGIVSDRQSRFGPRLVIHNMGGGTHEEPLGLWARMTGRYRWRV